jgi:hypothetical protein
MPTPFEDGEGREEVTDVLFAQFEVDLLRVDFTVPLEIGDAISVDDDALDRQLLAPHLPALRAAWKQQERSQEDQPACPV